MFWEHSWFLISYFFSPQGRHLPRDLICAYLLTNSEEKPGEVDLCPNWMLVFCLYLTSPPLGLTMVKRAESGLRNGGAQLESLGFLVPFQASVSYVGESNKSRKCPSQFI